VRRLETLCYCAAAVAQRASEARLAKACTAQDDATKVLAVTLPGLLISVSATRGSLTRRQILRAIEYLTVAAEDAPDACSPGGARG
jgi:hypothetical protein